jgi:hypothetical protein
MIESMNAGAGVVGEGPAVVCKFLCLGLHKAVLRKGCPHHTAAHLLLDPCQAIPVASAHNTGKQQCSSVSVDATEAEGHSTHPCKHECWHGCDQARVARVLTGRQMHSTCT